MRRNGRALPCVRVMHVENRTPTGRRSATPAKKAAAYFALGKEKKGREAGRRQADAQRAEWVGPDGQKHAHASVMDWARSQALVHRYTFQALLSVPEGRLTAADYGRALAAAGAISVNAADGSQAHDWRMVVHDDTAYSHAHVLFFGDRRVEKERYLAWRERIQEELAALEERRLEGQALAQESAQEDTPFGARDSAHLNRAEMAPDATYDASAGLELE